MSNKFTCKSFTLRIIISCSRWQRSANLLYNLFMQLRLHIHIPNDCQKKIEREKTKNRVSNRIWSLSKFVNVQLTYIYIIFHVAFRMDEFDYSFRSISLIPSVRTNKNKNVKLGFRMQSLNFNQKKKWKENILCACVRECMYLFDIWKMCIGHAESNSIFAFCKDHVALSSVTPLILIWWTQFFFFIFLYIIKWML